MTAAKTYPSGVTSWVDTEQPDLATAQTFYTDVLGWTFHRATPADAKPYLVAQIDGRDVAGLAQADSGATATWNTYVAVDDAHAAAVRFADAGGTITAQPTAAGEAGVSAAGLDPDGHEIRLWQPGKRLGAQLVNAPGSWNFSDLHTNEPSRVKLFYADVFGWEFADLGYGTMIRRPGYGDHLAATTDPQIHERQASVGAPPGFADAIGWLAPASDSETPGWHVTFAVADRDAGARAAESRGGTIEATDTNDWTKTALVRDPQGALFTLSQFLR